MKYCENCAASIDNNAKFCPECGSKIQDIKMSINPINDDIQGTNSINDDYMQHYNTTTSDNDEVTNTIESYGADSNNSSINYTQTDVQPPNKGLTWLIISIISMCCCGGILQLIPVIFSIISMVSYSNGDYDSANNYARTAKILFFVFLAISLIILIIALATGVVSGVFEEIYNY